MINIRYHIVSITAVFLALGLGVALGSTFLDGATVDVLERNIKSAENRISATNAENDRLNDQLDKSNERDDSLILVGSEALLDGELQDLPVLVVAAPGVENGDTEVLASMLVRSGADFRGTLQLTEKLDFTGGMDTDLATDLGLGDTDLATLKTAVRGSITDALLAAGLPLDDRGLVADAPDDDDPLTTTSTTTPNGSVPGGTSVPDGEQPAAITALIERGYLKVNVGPGYADDDPILESAGYRYVYLGAPELDAAQNDTLLNLLPSTGPALPATVITGTQPAPLVDQTIDPTVVARVRASDDLRQRYNTVDDSDTFAGLVASIFTLRDMGAVSPGQYGQADGASAVLPPPS
jgi:hypothetical protein